MTAGGSSPSGEPRSLRVSAIARCVTSIAPFSSSSGTPKVASMASTNSERQAPGDRRDLVGVLEKIETLG